MFNVFVFVVVFYVASILFRGNGRKMSMRSASQPILPPIVDSLRLVN